MREALKARRPFYGLFLAWAVVGGLTIATTEQPDLHLTLNNATLLGWHTFFKWATLLGDGYFAYGFALLLGLARPRWGLAVFLSCLLAGLTSQVLKQAVFGPVPRPVTYFGEPTPLYLVPGLDQHLLYSFPSGHSAVAFALATSLMLLSPWRSLRAGLFFLALLAAFSRVYLSQHFFEDIYAGSFIGLIAGLLAHRLMVVRKPRVEPAEMTEASAINTVV
jgi:membrane-associated phospholipid phosphatase